MVTRLLAMMSLLWLPVGNAQFFFCKPLSNETWAGFVEAVNDSFRLAVLCPFRITGDACPSVDEYPEGLVVGRGDDDGVEIIECDRNFRGRYDERERNTECIIDCPGRHFTVGPSANGLILTNMILSGATNTSIFVEEGATLEIVNGRLENNDSGSNLAGAVQGLDGSEISIEFSTFRGNRGIDGGAISIQGNSNMGIRQSSFFRNSATDGGAALGIGSESLASVDSSSFTANQAVNGGAIFVDDLASLSVLRSVFQNNTAVGFGGGIHLEGDMTVDQSTFIDNTGIDGGGAINCGRGSSNTILNSAFINNLSSRYGPAVFDQSNTRSVRSENSACGNQVNSNGVNLRNRILNCNGVYTIQGRRILRRCQAFENRCVAPTGVPTTEPPTQTPSSSPSQKPTSAPSKSPTLAPSWSPSVTVSNTPSLSPSQIPSNSPSEFLSGMPSSVPSLGPSYIPSDGPSAGPSYIPSDTPSLVPSQMVSDIPSDTPSLIPSRMPSKIPSDAPSLMPSTTRRSMIPSDAPSLLPSSDPMAPPMSVVIVEP